MSNKSPKFWIGVACKEHVENAKKLGICQFCHGKSAPAKRLSAGDFVIYYSPKIAMNGTEFYQKFTAIGRVVDDNAYQVDLGDDFKPFRRNVCYLDAQDVEVKLLVPSLSFIKNKKSWGYIFRFGFFEIDQESFEIIAQKMLGFNPLTKN